MTKKCSQCKNFKELYQFRNRTRAKDGLSSYCRKCANENDKKYRSVNKERKAKTDKRWKENNKEKMRIYFRERKRKERRTNPLAKLKNNLQRRIHKALKGQVKSASTVQLLGASIQAVMKILESQFQPGMTWENYGEWHIDHKIPVASAKNKEELEKLFHYTNLQPLWALDNIRKSDTMPAINLNESTSLEEKV